MNQTNNLRRMLHQGPPPRRLAQTQQRCAALLAGGCRRRAGFWQFLSEVWRFAGGPMWAAQGGVALLFALAAAGRAQEAACLPLLGPVLVAVSLPALFAGRRYAMDELEATTCLSVGELMLAKLVLAAAADGVALTVVVLLGWARAQVPLLPLLLHLWVPFLVCALAALVAVRRFPRGGAQLCFGVCAATAAGLMGVRWYVPQLYTVSALGGWAVLFVLFAVFFFREAAVLIRRREAFWYVGNAME